MLHYDAIRVSINLANEGVYALGWEGGTGKSALYERLMLATRLGTKDVCPITYNATLSTTDIYDIILSSPAELIILDRADLYVTLGMLEVLKLKKCITLIDIKNLNIHRKFQFKHADVILQQNNIAVEEAW